MSAAAAGGFGPIVRLEETDSTNADALRAAQGRAPHGLVVVADYQRAGRGRRRRRWLAASGSSLLCSILFRPTIELEDFPLVAAALALAARDAVGSMCSLEVMIKWPNDLVVGDRKLAGLLAQHVNILEPGGAVVVGIGLNLRLSPEFLASEDAMAAGLATSATSLETETGRPVERELLLGQLLKHLGDRYAVLAAPGGVAATVAALRQASATIGRRVRIELEGRTFVGEAIDLDDHGRLIVSERGRVTVVDAADVVHLREGGR